MNEQRPVETVALEGARYTLGELGARVHLLARRAEHRADKDKAHKDLTDARNYLAMMSARLDALAVQLGIEVEPAP